MLHSACDVYIFLFLKTSTSSVFEGTVTTKNISLEGHLWHSYLKQKSRNFRNRLLCYSFILPFFYLKFVNIGIKLSFISYHIRMLKTRVLFLKSPSSQSTLPVPSRKTWYINQLSIKPSLLIIPASSNNEVHVRIPSHSDSNIIWCQSRIQRRAPPVERQRSQRWVQPQQLLLRDVGTDAPSKVR